MEEIFEVLDDNESHVIEADVVVAKIGYFVDVVVRKIRCDWGMRRCVFEEIKRSFCDEIDDVELRFVEMITKVNGSETDVDTTTRAEFHMSGIF